MADDAPRTRKGWRNRLSEAWRGLTGDDPAAHAERAGVEFAGDAAELSSPAPVDDDSPITEAAQDRFGVDAFAGIVARSLAEQGNAEGTVVALNGPWGSGKSSAVNLVVNHLEREGRDEIEVIRFNPWWFAGSDQLARAFLGEVSAKIGKNIGNDGRDALKGIAARLSKLDTYVEAARRAGDDGIGSGVTTLLFEGRSVEDDHRRLSAALRAARRRFVVLIDDIDRLNPDEALQMFQLVKSVGRLPRVCYLLAFDRLLIERLLHERYPAEGGRYLEKVLQATFDLPEPSRPILRRMVLDAVHELMNVPEEEGVRFMNTFEDVVVPRLTSPRHAIRYLGSIRTTWPTVGDDVDPADFMGIEAIRVFEPSLYRAIRSNGPLVRGEDAAQERPRDQRSANADGVLLDSVDAEWREWAKKSLQRLFPPLEGVWGGMHYGSDWRQVWDRRRLICTLAHFPTYFSYAVPAETLSKAERRSLVDATGEPGRLREMLLAATRSLRPDGGTRAALMLDELALLGDRVPLDRVGAMIDELSSIGDDLVTKADERRGFGSADNVLRLHWLVNAQVRERVPFGDRGKILETALDGAQIGWRMGLADRLATDHEPPKDGERERTTPLVDESTARRLQADAEMALVSAAHDGSLISSSQADRLLWRLTRLDDGEKLARGISDGLLATDAGTARLAELLITTSWSQGMGFAGLGDRVAKGSPRVQRKGLERVVDPDILYARVSEALASASSTEEEKTHLARFLKGWEEKD